MTKILTDEDGKKYEVVFDDVVQPSSSNKHMLVKPLPTPPAKERYSLEMNGAGGLNAILWEELELTESQAEALSKAIEALLQYCNDTPKNPAMPFFPKYLVDACEASRAAIQDGSAA